MVLEVQDTKQNYKTKALKMSKGVCHKRKGKCGKVRKIQTPRMYKKKLKSQLDMRAKWSLKSKHQNNARLHNKTLNTKFMALGGIMESVMGAFHNTFPLLDRLLLKRPRVKIKWYSFSRESTHRYLTHFWLKDLIFGINLFLLYLILHISCCIVYILIHTTLLSKNHRNLKKLAPAPTIPIDQLRAQIANFRHINTDTDKSWIYIVGGGSGSGLILLLIICGCLYWRCKNPQYPGARSPPHVTYTAPENQNMMHITEDAIRSTRGSDLGLKTVRIQDQWGTWER